MNSDGIALRVLNPSQAVRAVQIRLTTDEQAAFALFLQAWCENPPTLRSLGSQELWYDLGLRCNPVTYDTTQFQVPVDQLPAFFAQLNQRLPLIATP